MPRFTEAERDKIQAALLQEGELLFSAHGLKKVTVDDLAEAASISKGSFYAFFQNKEHLFMVINFNIQDRLLKEVKSELDEHKYMQPKELATYILKCIFTKATQYPILSGIDKATMLHLQRKLPPELFAAHTRDDVAMVCMLADYRIEFSRDVALVAKTLQTLFACSNILLDDQDYDKIMSILIGGIINLIKK